MKINFFQLGVLGTNCYLLEKDKSAIIIDPGGDAHLLIDYLENHQLTLKAVLLTHAHFDHIGGVEELRNQTNAPVYIHEQEADWLTNPGLNGSERFQVGTIRTSEPADNLIEPGSMTIGEFEFEVLHTPGHSPGSVSFWFEHEQVVFGGDTLFNGGIGRTDLPFGEHETLIRSIKDKLFVLGDSTTVFPGHGPQTSVGHEKDTNPFLA